MDAAELTKLATEKGVPAIRVVMTGDESKLPRVEGTLDDFWAAAKSLGAKAVFLLVMQMDESDFERDVPADDAPNIDGDDDDESFDGETYWVKLEEVRPSISKFRKHAGKDCAFILIAKGGVAEVDYLLTEPWWDEFQDDASKAVESWLESRNAKHQDAEAASKENNTKLVELLRGLINDREFCLLRTHRAKIDYAIEKFPQLGKLNEFILKPEIQKLADRIEAKGLNRKRP